jgi:hypothetical protein
MTLRLSLDVAEGGEGGEGGADDGRPQREHNFNVVTLTEFPLRNATS